MDFAAELPQRFLLYLPFPALDRVCVHWPTEPAPAYESTCSGLLYPRSSRPVAHEGFLFRVPVRADAARAIYIEAESRTPMSLDAELVRADAFVGEDHGRQFQGGLFTGVLLLAAIYNLVFFSGNKDRAALYYALHLTALGLAVLGFEGKGSRASLALVRKGDRPARYLLLGLSPPLIVGLVVIGLRVLGIAWIPRPLGVAATKAGLLIGAASMSLALNQRLRELRRQRDRARADAAAQQQIALHRAYFDELTGLPNRNRFMADGTQLLGETLNDSGALAVLVLNVVRFREVSHALGQAGGDLVLVELGRRLREALGRSALVARLGGDEFAAAFTIDPDRVRRRAALRRRASSLLEGVSIPQVVEGRNVRLSATIGIAIAPDHGQTLAELVRDAEIAIEWARANGAEGPVLYSAKDRPEPEAELALRTELWRAVDSDEIEVFYQPQHEIETGVLTGAEARVRWRHPRLGLLPPGGFIGLAEQSELAATPRELSSASLAR